MITIHMKVWLKQSGRFAFGERGLDLFRHILPASFAYAGDLSRRLVLSTAWDYLRNAERHLGEPLVHTSPGEAPAKARFSAQPATVFCVAWIGHNL